jgi:signal transduction histidine kinase
MNDANTTRPTLASVALACKDFGRREFLRELAWVAGINVAIAGFLNVMVFRGNGFTSNLVFSECIGLSIFLLVTLARVLIPHPWVWIGWVAALPSGFILGMALASRIVNVPFRLVWLGLESTWTQALLISTICTLMFGYFFWSRERLAEARALAEQERARALSNQKQAVEAQLRALQAQIEPHFLFNTLANVVSLIERDGPRARHMLEEFIGYLRDTLAETRVASSTLGRQIELLRAYLRLLQFRMGQRLRYELAVPPELEALELPPMLLQPLVENAIKHGLEPKVEGGEVVVSARRENQELILCVADTGIGFGAGMGGSGVGLANVRERLKGLYGERASLDLTENTPGGVVVSLRIPLGQGAGADPVRAP